MRETLAAINRVFQQHGEIAIAVTRNPFTHKSVLTITDTYARLPIVPAKKVTQQAIVRLLPELEDAVGRIYRKRIKLRFGKNPFSLEIPLPKPRYTQFELDDELPPFHAKIGRSFLYGKPHDVTFNLTDSNSAHMFVAGMVGCGKSNVLENLLLSLAYSTSPADLRIYMVDMKKRSLARLNDLPHVAASASSESEAEEVVKSVFQELLYRRDNTNIETDRILLIIDELRELKFVDQNILSNYLPRIISLGREIGIHVVAATQKPSSGDLGPIVNALIPVRVVGVVEDAKASYHVLKHAGAGAESLIGRGDMLVSTVTDDPVRMQAYLVGDATAFVPQIQQKWHGITPAEQPVISPVEETPEPQHEEIPEHVKEVFWQYYDEKKGKLRYGGLTKVAKALYGEDVAVQGHIHREMNRICAEIVREKNTERQL